MLLRNQTCLRLSASYLTTEDLGEFCNGDMMLQSLLSQVLNVNYFTVSFMAKEPVDLGTLTMKNSIPLRQAAILLQAGQNSSVNLTAQNCTLNLSFSPHFIPGTNDGLEIQLCPKVNQKMFKYADTDFTTYLTSSNDAIPAPALIMAQ